MSFKIGDEITLIVNNPSCGCLQAGNIGIVKGIHENDYAIEFDFGFTDMHDCEGLIPSGRGWFVTEDEFILSKDSRNILSQEKAELLDALKKLWNVRSQAWTDKQAQHKLEVECEVEAILKKYVH